MPDIKRRDFIKTTATGAAIGALGSLGATAFAQSQENKRLNILYILTDQWRASATGYAGDPNVRTPNLDTLADQSLRFTNAVSVCPICTPYRAALMTGRYPTTNGMFLNDASLPDGEQCIAEVLAEAGYATGYIGKWHLDGRGRDAFVVPERRQGWQYWKAAECEHNYRKSHYYANQSPQKKFWEGNYDAYPQTKDAQKYIRDHANKEKPFALMISYGGPHAPHPLAPEDLKATYPPGEIQLPPNVPPKMVPKSRKAAQGYYAHCTAIDKCVGELRQTLEEAGIADNTIVIFTSDHGEALGSHGAPPKSKQIPWSVSSKVPFILHHPGIKNRVVKTPINTTDIYPTLTALAGTKAPKTVEGEDLSSLIKKDAEDLDRVALYMNPAPFGMRPAFRRPYRAIQTATHTYVRGLKGPWLLYENESDPHQLNNLAKKTSACRLGCKARCTASEKTGCNRR